MAGMGFPRLGLNLGGNRGRIRPRLSRGQHTGSIATAYNPREVEEKWGGRWDRGRVRMDQPFSMVLPPPNITGSLHLGHALTCAVQDSIVRWQRMSGKDVVWVPGLDHAGIATQAVVEQQLFGERKSRKDMGKEEFQRHVWEWKEKTAERIRAQIRRVGATVDWGRERFTLDPQMSLAVTEAFVRLHQSGTIYRGEGMVNWCCRLQSVISDIEVESIAIQGSTKVKVPGYKSAVEFGRIYRVAYPLLDGNEKLVVATTRPETMLGDVALAINPNDNRYKHLHGKSVMHPFRNVPIPIVCDDAVKIDFGTGIVKVTPAHDQNDFEIAKRHQLPSVIVIDSEGKIMCSPYQGMKRFDARRVILEKLGQMELLISCEDHVMNLPVCSRTGDVIEPMVRQQWFMKCDALAQSAVKAVRDGQLRLNPRNYENVWFEWLENIRDWCISRQLWWGHRVPAYQYNKDGTQQWVAACSEAEARAKVGNLDLTQDEDVLDTWFSSALFPFAVFGWPNKTEDLSRYYPLSLMETGNDILFFWVARMVMMGIALTGQVPFKEVLLHGLVCDKDGRKMTKSLGNVIDPMDVINGCLDKKIPECGADALRYSLCSYDIKSQFINVNLNHMHSSRLFCNKIWQAVRFLKQASPQNMTCSLTTVESRLDSMDRWILSRVSDLVSTAEKSMAEYNLHLAVEAIRNFLYSELCDVYIETTKPSMYREDEQVKVAKCQVLLTCLETGLRVLHPFMPNVTSELISCLTEAELPNISYPQKAEWSKWDNIELEDQVKQMMAVVQYIRHQKAMYRVTKSKPSVIVRCKSIDDANSLVRFENEVRTLSQCSDVQVQTSSDISTEGHSVGILNSRISVYMNVKGLLNVEKELQDLAQQQDKVSKKLDKLGKVMSADGYHQAPAKVQMNHNVKKQALVEELTKLKECARAFASLGSK